MVSVADDGGSSGRLRRQLGIVPPGDLRKCLVALAEDGLGPGRRPSSSASTAEELVGHALGNLVIAGLMAAVRRPPEGPRRGGPAARGRGPGGARPPPSRWCSRPRPTAGEIEGQTAVDAHAATSAGCRSCPPTRRPRRVALAALAQADQVVVGPGVAVHERAGRRGRPRDRRGHPALARAPGLRGQPAAPAGARRPASTWPTTWPPWPPTASRSTWWWPTPPPSPSGSSRCRWWTRPWPRPTGWPMTRQDWRPPSAGLVG